MCVVSRHVLFLARRAISQPVCDLPFQLCCLSVVFLVLLMMACCSIAQSSGRPCTLGKASPRPLCRQVPPPLPGLPSQMAPNRSPTGHARLAFASWEQLLELRTWPRLLFGPEENPERVSFLEKARRGMAAGFLRGHTLCGSTVSAMEVVVLVLSNWGDQGEPHPDVPSLPLGLRVLVLSLVKSHRRKCLVVIPIIHAMRLVTTFGPFYSRTSGRDANRLFHGPPGPHSSGTFRTASNKLWSK